MTTSTTLQSLFMKEDEERRKEQRNWLDLPPELTTSILLRLSVTDILFNAQKVCRQWRRVCKDPSMWQKINLQDCLYRFDFEGMCRHIVDLSQGGLLEINIGHFVSDSLLSYIADRSSNLKGLGLSIYEPMTNEGVLKGIAKFPWLETLEVFHSSFKLDLKAIGHACPQLKTLKLNFLGCPGHDNYLRSQVDLISPPVECDDDALAIAESMPKLRHLQLIWNGLTNTGLNVILDGCPHLEDLDVRKCFNIKLVGNLEKRCLERIKELRRPGDSTADYPYNIEKKMKTSSPSPMKDEEPRSWADLPSELTSLILIRLSVADILNNAQKVCRPWRRVCKEPSMWRKIDMRNLIRDRGMLEPLAIMCRHAVDRSEGGLVKIHLGNFVNDDLLDYIADRSKNLRSLGLGMCFPRVTRPGLVNAITKLPLLETLEVSHSCLNLSLEDIGHACPQLKTLKLNSSGGFWNSRNDDDYALEIAKSMPELRHLHLYANNLSYTRLNAILDGCPHLERLVTDVLQA
ncbi:unnamed protein product [Arabidopsis arenosa]|uniref:F-box domain-containing protein n=1 Tax=Arabidopsis arenosa TaxID=38785 RepID=A0A8S2AMJ1_ARAAE|nr:unnamed protein product [Arabidopsis arenosa]